MLALAIGLLLNAPGIHKSAYNKPAGWQRDVALAVTGPLAGVSHALLLDRPRSGVQALVGRSGTTRSTPISGSRPAAEGEADNDDAARDPPHRRVHQAQAAAQGRLLAEEKLRIWIAGDSLVIEPGYAIVRAAGASPAMEPVGTVDGRVATGLTRPDVFNWFDEIRDRSKELHPKVVVLAFGGNDDKAYMTGLSRRHLDRRLRRLGVAQGVRAQGGRRDGHINRAGALVIWIGLPQTRRPSRRGASTSSTRSRRQARKRAGRAAYVDTYTMFAGDDGGYAQYLPDGSGRLEKVRADDGVHFERTGGDMIARVVLKELNKEFDLTSWRKKPTA